MTILCPIYQKNDCPRLFFGHFNKKRLLSGQRRRKSENVHFHHKRVCIQILSDAFTHISNFSPTIKQPQTMDGALVGLGAIAPHKTKNIYIWELILAILFYKIILFLLKNIIDSFKSIFIVTKFSITFLQIVKVTNSF